jgi:hypothetical protein
VVCAIFSLASDVSVIYGRNKLNSLYVGGIASLLVKKYAKDFSVAGVDVGQFYF